MSYEHHVIVGNLGKDPVLRVIEGSGKKVCNFSVAVNKYNNEAQWWRVSVWGNDAENCDKYLKKGSMVAVEGEVTASVWEGDAQLGIKIGRAHV